MELLDVFEADLNYLGKATRDKIHEEGLWHQTFHCWIIRPNNKVILQLRSKTKKTDAGLLDISSAGHIEAGEKPENGIREIQEELGLKVNFENLVYLGYFKWATDHNRSNNAPYHNRELCHSYFLKDNTPLDKYQLQPEEVDGVFELDINEGLKLFSKEIDKIKITGYIRKDDNTLEKNERVVERKDFTKYDRFWIKILHLIEDYNNGRKHLSI